MDLTHDWKALNEVLFSQQNGLGASSTLVLLENDGPPGNSGATKVIDGVVSNGRAFTDTGIDGVSTQKERLDSLAAKYGVDQTVVLSKGNLDQYVIEAATLGPNYFQQIQMLRSKVMGQRGSGRAGRMRSSAGNELIVSRRHFVLDLFGHHLRRILPRRFNVLLFVDQRMVPVGSQPVGALSYRAILLSYSGGQLDQFFEPDFSSLHEERLVNWQQESDAIGQYLESRYILPCYGIFMLREDWERCLQKKGKPWQEFIGYYDEGRSAVYPETLMTKALLASQRVMVYFSRLWKSR